VIRNAQTEIDKIRRLVPREKCNPKQTHLRDAMGNMICDGVWIRPPKIGDKVLVSHRYWVVVAITSTRQCHHVLVEPA